MTIISADYFDISFCGYFPRYNHRCHVISRYYELQYVASGGVDLDFEGQHYRIEGGGGWLINPAIDYTYRPQEKYGWWEHRFIVFSGSIVDYWRDAGLLPKLPWQAPSGLGFAARLDRVIELARQIHLPLNRIEAANLMEKIFIDLRRVDAATPEPPWLERILARLNTATGSPDYQKLAAAGGMSRRTLFRQFQIEMGMTPHQYYLRARIKMAERLLETTTLPINDIAAQLGYADPAHLARQFKSVNSITPGEYRDRKY